MASRAAEARAFAALFGPAEAARAQAAAAAAATLAGSWLKEPNTEFELRRPGLREGQQLTRHIAPNTLEQAFRDAARLGAESDLRKFLDGVEVALYALSRLAGDRYLIAILDAPVLNDDDAARLQQIAESAKSVRVKILVVDLAGSVGGKRTGTWQALAKDTGGSFATDPGGLDAVVPRPPPPAMSLVAPEGRMVPAELVGPAVYIRYFPQAPASANRSGSTLGSMRGLLIVEAPLRNLQANGDGRSTTARVRLTGLARSRNGEIAWQATKELTSKRGASKAGDRKTGSLLLWREVRLPAGEYMLEGTVEDLNAERKAEVKQPFQAKDALPGLAISGALLVRKPVKGVDVMDADQVIQYDGEGFAPMLNPAFPAGTPFELEVYFLFYPDMNGKRPVLRLDILKQRDIVGGADLAFGDSLRDDARSGRGGLAGEQKHEYPYLAKLAGAVLNEGEYEVRITVRQDKQEVSASAPFRVVTAGR